MSRFKFRRTRAPSRSWPVWSSCACSGGAGDDASSTSSAASSTVNLCLGQPANSFHCLDDTKFELCTGFSNGFVINSCPPGLCATRHPPIQNPCIGAARATEIDGVPPTPPGQIDDAPGGSAPSAPTASPPPAAPPPAAPPPPATSGGNTGGNDGQCVGGPKFDPAGEKNVGNGAGRQFIGGQCLDAADCASGCGGLPCGICSGPGAQFQAGKQGCGFGG